MISSKSTCVLNDCAAECRHNPEKACPFRRPPAQPRVFNGFSHNAEIKHRKVTRVTTSPTADGYSTSPGATATATVTPGPGPAGTPYPAEPARRAVR